MAVADSILPSNQGVGCHDASEAADSPGAARKSSRKSVNFSTTVEEHESPPSSSAAVFMPMNDDSDDEDTNMSQKSSLAARYSALEASTSVDPVLSVSGDTEVHSLNAQDVYGNSSGRSSKRSTIGPRTSILDHYSLDWASIDSQLPDEDSHDEEVAQKWEIDEVVKDGVNEEVVRRPSVPSTPVELPPGHSRVSIANYDDAPATTSARHDSPPMKSTPFNATATPVVATSSSSGATEGCSEDAIGDDSPPMKSTPFNATSAPVAAASRSSGESSGRYSEPFCSIASGRYSEASIGDDSPPMKRNPFNATAAPVVEPSSSSGASGRYSAAAIGDDSPPMKSIPFNATAAPVVATSSPSGAIGRYSEAAIGDDSPPLKSTPFNATAAPVVEPSSSSGAGGRCSEAAVGDNLSLKSSSDSQGAACELQEAQAVQPSQGFNAMSQPAIGSTPCGDVEVAHSSMPMSSDTGRERADTLQAKVQALEAELAAKAGCKQGAAGHDEGAEVAELQAKVQALEAELAQSWRRHKAEHFAKAGADSQTWQRCSTISCDEGGQHSWDVPLSGTSTPGSAQLTPMKEAHCASDSSAAEDDDVSASCRADQKSFSESFSAAFAREPGASAEPNPSNQEEWGWSKHVSISAWESFSKQAGFSFASQPEGNRSRSSTSSASSSSSEESSVQAVEEFAARRPQTEEASSAVWDFWGGVTGHLGLLCCNTGRQTGQRPKPAPPSPGAWSIQLDGAVLAVEPDSPAHREESALLNMVPTPSGMALRPATKSDATRDSIQHQNALMHMVPSPSGMNLVSAISGRPSFKLDASEEPIEEEEQVAPVLFSLSVNAAA